MCFKSKYVTVDVVVGVVDKIPIDGVGILLGNNLSGGQGEICPVLCEKPVVADAMHMQCAT